MYRLFFCLGLVLGMTVSPAWSETPAVPTDAAAQVQLGLKYIEGESVEPDDAMAATLFRKAAEQGNADGQFNLGLLYIRGAGVAKDDVEAYKWLTLAGQGGRKDALAVRDGIAGRMTPEQLGRARALARQWQSQSPKS